MRSAWLSVLFAVVLLSINSLFGADEATRTVAKVNGKTITA